MQKFWQNHGSNVGKFGDFIEKIFPKLLSSFWLGKGLYLIILAIPAIIEKIARCKMRSVS